MAYVSVPKDLTCVKKKLVGNFTKRQCILFPPGILLGVGLFFATRNVIGKDLAIYLMMAVMLPFFIASEYQKNGRYIEVILKNYIETQFIRNSARPYETENGYMALLRQQELEREVKKILLQSNKISKKQKEQIKRSSPLQISPNMPLDWKTKKEIRNAVEKAKRDGKIPKSAQQTLPYQEMGRDGICEIEQGIYSKSIAFFDINYRLEENDSKNAIYEKWCDFLNYYDQSIHVQLSFMNLDIDITELKQSIHIEEREDAYNDVRREFVDMLKGQLEKGNNHIDKSKCITYTVKAKGYKEAKAKLEKVTRDTLNNFKKLGVAAIPLDGYTRLQQLYKIMHQGEKSSFLFNWDAIYKTGLSSKDFIAPSSFDFKNSVRMDARHYFGIGKRIGAVSYLNILAPELSDEILSDFLDMESNIIVTLHIDTVDQQEAIKTVKGNMSDIQKMKIDEQKKAARSGYDMDILPPDITTYEKETVGWLEGLQKRNERMFLVSVIIMQTGRSKKELDNNIYQAEAIAKGKHNCQLLRLDDRQEQGFMSSLPLGKCFVGIQRGLDTTSTAVFTPFNTVELFQKGEALYYGMNTLSNNLIMISRKALKSPNGLILGKPGGGKSFAAKREILNAFLVSDDDIIISDPESEYGPLVNHLGGQLVKLSLNSPHHINPMDINVNYSDEDSETSADPISLKSDFILSLCELIAGGRNGLEADEIGIIDRCVRKVYEKWIVNPVPENIPILGDLYEMFRADESPKARRIADALEAYVHGSYKIFNNRTNVDVTNRVVCYDTKDLGKQLKKIGMLIVQDQTWNRVSMNRGKKYTRFYDDEFHLKLKDKQTAEYSIEIWKRFRKFGGIPTGITQNVKDLFRSADIETILDNSEFIYMLSQGHNDAEILAETLNISDEQLKYVENAPEGEGLIFYGDKIVPFNDHFPKDTIAYKLMTTKPGEAS